MAQARRILGLVFASLACLLLVPVAAHAQDCPTTIYTQLDSTAPIYADGQQRASFTWRAACMPEGASVSWQMVQVLDYQLPYVNDPSNTITVSPQMDADDLAEGAGAWTPPLGTTGTHAVIARVMHGQEQLASAGSAFFVFEPTEQPAAADTVSIAPTNVAPEPTTVASTPAAASAPAQAKLVVRVSASRYTRIGNVLRVRVQLRNQSNVQARGAVLCLRTPVTIRIVNAKHARVRHKRIACWKVSALRPGQRAARILTSRVSSHTKRGKNMIYGYVSAANANRSAHRFSTVVR